MLNFQKIFAKDLLHRRFIYLIRDTVVDFARWYMLSKKQGYTQGILSLIIGICAIVAIIPIVSTFYTPGNADFVLKSLILPMALWFAIAVIIAIFSFFRKLISSIIIILISWHSVPDALHGLYYYFFKTSAVLNIGFFNYISLIGFIAELALVIVAVYIILNRLFRKAKSFNNDD